MTRTLLAITAAASLTAITAASAQVNARQGDQQVRIDRGVATGQLTPGEAARDRRQQGRIEASKVRMRARDGGGPLTPGQRARLNARQSAASEHITATKHNLRGY